MEIWRLATCGHGLHRFSLYERRRTAYGYAVSIGPTATLIAAQQNQQLHQNVDGEVNRKRQHNKLECGPMSNVTAAPPNIGGAFCESSVIPFVVPRHKVWLTAAARVPCSNVGYIVERKTWMQSEFCRWQNSVRGQEPPNMYI